MKNLSGRTARLITLMRSSDFIRHNSILFVGSFAVSVLNYLYYPILGRLMSPSDFGEVQVLVSLFMQATIFLTVVTNVAVNVVTNESNETLRNRIVYELEHFATLITVVTLGVALLFIGQLQEFLRFEHPAPFFALALVLVISAPLALRQAYLRGRSAFGLMSIASITSSLAKIIFSVIFVLLGWRAVGAIGGIIAAQIIALIYTASQARKLGLVGKINWRLWRKPDLGLLRPQLPYSLLVLIVSLITTVLFSFDVIIVKHFFPAEIAGYYAGIATIARIIYFLTGSIAVVLLTAAKIEAGRATNHRLLTRSMLLQTAIGGAALVFFSLFPQFSTQLLIGSKYLPYAHLLPMLSLALFILATLNLLLHYDLALRRYSAAVVSILGGVVMIAAVQMNHASLEAVVQSLLIGSLAALAIRGLDSLRRRALQQLQYPS